MWNTSVVPKLIPQPKWINESAELRPGDITYFQKTESELPCDWTVGLVHYVTRSWDNGIRRGCQVFQSQAEKAQVHGQGVQSMVKLFSIDDYYFMHNMA